MKLIRQGYAEPPTMTSDAKRHVEVTHSGGIKVEPVTGSEVRPYGGSSYRGGVRINIGQRENASKTIGSIFWLQLERQEALELAEKLIGCVRSKLEEKG